MSYPMCLSEALAGYSFCGADIGGFFHNPDPELLYRWYQAGAWLPFYRSHAHIDTKRREPYLYDQDVQMYIRNTLKLRYAHLPLWYTIFYEHWLTGEPVIRPLFYQYPKDDQLVDIDNQLIVGTHVMVAPVTESNQNTINVHLPGGNNELWYDIETFKMYRGNGAVSLPVAKESIPVFYRGGSIIPRKDRPRRASSLTHNDPYTLYVVLDSNNRASGTLYIDDGETYNYKKKKYIYLRFVYKDNKLTSSLIDSDASFDTKSWLERVIVVGSDGNFKQAKLTTKDGEELLPVLYDAERHSFTIRKPGVNMQKEFAITLS